MGKTMAQVNVSHLNKKEAKSRIGELEKAYTSDKYAICLTECNQGKTEFLNKL